MKFEVEIKRTDACDVLVVGGGVAGFAAAVRPMYCPFAALWK